MSNERKSIEEMTADTEKPVRDRKTGWPLWKAMR